MLNSAKIGNIATIISTVDNTETEYKVVGLTNDTITIVWQDKHIRFCCITGECLTKISGMSKYLMKLKIPDV